MRRQVTVLFADMAGYTSLAERLGEEQTYLVMQRVHRALNKAIHVQDGTVLEMTGDGVMALFGVPIAVEDAPLRACRAALEIQAQMAALAGDIETEHGVRPEFRVGIHSGPLVVGEVGDAQRSGVTALGDTVNLAARIEAQAATGEILLSAATHKMVEGFVDCTFAGERDIKGKADKQSLWRLDRVKEGITRFDVARSRGLTRLIGRERELDQLEALWREAAAGKVRIATILGEPGIGKSRLVHELRQRIDGERTFFLQGHCTAGSRATPFAPLIEVVRSSYRIQDIADAAEATRKLTLGLEVLGIEPDSTLPYLLNLLGYPSGDAQLETIAGETLGIRTRDAILAMLRERCRISPTAMIMEDLHWVDTATDGLLQRVVAEAEDIPLLLLATARTGYRPSWSGADNSVEVRLTALPKGATAALLKAILGATELPDALVEAVAEKSQGNPLFVEEIIDYLRVSGAIRQQEGGIVFQTDNGKATLPATIENLLMDRFDRLDEGPRAVLEAAAVVGPRFAGTMVGAVTGLDGGVDSALQELVAQELIQSESVSGVYRFRHALVRDAIYGSLLSPQRQALHERIAENIEGKQDEFFDGAVESLAHHWSHAKRADKAVKYLALAGENALRVYSLDEAEAKFRQALDLIAANAGCAGEALVADLVLNLARVMYYQSKFFAIIALVEPYLPRVEALDDKKRLSRFLFEAGYAHVFASKVVKGRALLGRARALGEEIGDELAIAYADLGALWDRMFWGTPGQARHLAQREAAERIVGVGLRHRDIWLASKAQLALGLDIASWGRPNDGRAELMKLMAMSRETNDPRPRAMALWALATINTLAGNYAEAIESADESLRISLSPIDRNSALTYKLMSMVLSGQVDDGMGMGLHLIRKDEELGFNMALAVPKMVMGVGALLQGEMAAGVRMIENTASEARDWGQTAPPLLSDLFLGESYLQMAIGGEKPPLTVLLRNLPFLLRTWPFAKAKARRHLNVGLTAYRELDMPGYIARCLYDLGRLDAATRRPETARANLDEARQIAASVELTNFMTDIDAAIAELSAA